MIQVVLDDAKAAGEHDRNVSESVEKELALEHTEETIRESGARRIAANRRRNLWQLPAVWCADSPTRDLTPSRFTSYCVNCERKLEE